jgi:hypothetical protein
MEHTFVYNKVITLKEVTVMAIRDRGKMKWQPASFMPEGFAMTREMYRDQNRQAKPLLDDYQTQEFDERISHAMEFSISCKVTCVERWVYGRNNGKGPLLRPYYKAVAP